MSIRKASETGDPPSGRGVQAQREFNRAGDEANAADGRFPTALMVCLLGEDYRKKRVCVKVKEPR
jgi:hypothetical protein